MKKLRRRIASNINRDPQSKPIVLRISLEELLEEWSVMSPGMWENNDGPKDWWAVCNNDGIIAYFYKEVDAFRFRLDQINRILNP